MRTISLILIMVLFLPLRIFCATGAVDSSYKYDYTQPPEFQPSLNSQFTALSCGVTDIFANPAGIMHVNTFEVAVGGSGFVSNPISKDTNTVYIDDVGAKGIEQSPRSRAYIALTDDRGSISPESRPFTIDEDYSKGGGINYFGTTYRVADWLAFSVSRRRPTAITFNYRLLTPVMANAVANLRGTSIEVGGSGNYINIKDDGTIEAFQSGVMIGTSDVSAWPGFLEQGTSEVNWANGTFNNSIINQNGIVISAAAKTGQFSWGLNVMPMTIDMELNNEVYVQSDSNNKNLKFYLPDLDFGSTFEALNWVTMECGTESGYRSIEVETVPGQQIGAAKIAGKYSASLTRMDLGMQWEPNDFISFGAVYENFNGATLRLSGVNVVQYVEHRIDTNSSMPTLESYWNPFLATPTHEVETERTIRNILTMQPIELPKKVKFGFALKKPVLVGVDWEQWQNEYKITSDPGHPETAHYIDLKDISFIRIGLESQVLFLPMIMRGSVTGMLRPTSSDPDTEKSLDDLYSKVPIVPVDGNIYFGFGVYDSEIGFGIGGGGLPLIQALMLDMSSIAKIFYANVYYKRGDMQISYLMTVDPVLTGFSSDVSTTPGAESSLKLMQTSTLSIGFKI